MYVQLYIRTIISTLLNKSARSNLRLYHAHPSFQIKYEPVSLDVITNIYEHRICFFRDNNLVNQSMCFVFIRSHYVRILTGISVGLSGDE